MSATNKDNSLPKPRLILRLGGLGNRKFGRDSETRIDELPATLQNAASEACDQVFAEIDRILHSIHAEDQRTPQPGQDARCKEWKTHCLARIFFGVKNRWERHRSDAPEGVFLKGVPPLVQVLTGGAQGGDTMIQEAGNRRTGLNSGAVDYKTLVIAPEDPATVEPAEGLGVGKPPEKRDDLAGKLKAGEVLTRAEAAEISRITRQRAFAYRAQSEALRHHSDILLAVWDPDAEGKAGGTSESVDLALRERIPVIAVRLREAGKAEIHVLESVEHLRALQGRSSAMPEKEWKPVLETVLGGILRFPDPPLPQPGDADHAEPTAYHPRAALAAFVRGQRLKPIWPARLWLAFDAQAKFRAARHTARHEKEPKEKDELEEKAKQAWRETVRRFWAIFWTKSAPQEKEQMAAASSAPPEGTFAHHYEPARKRAASSGLSGIYGDAHRGAIIASYLFAALAVMFAVFGVIAHELDAPAWVQLLTALGELFVIGVLFALSACSRAEGWNHAYTHSRILAEALRIMEYLGPMGVHTPLPRLPHYLRGDAKTPAPEEMWTVWYFRALVRMAPLRLSGPAPGGLEGFRRSLTEKWIRNQVDYHVGNTAKQETLHHDIEGLSKVLFPVVGVVAALHLADLLIGLHWMFIPCLIICVAGPALIAALHGFASQIENTRLRQRSSSMVKLLKEQKRRIDGLNLSTNPAGAEAVWGLATEALATGVLMMDEAASWSMLYTNTDIHAG